MLIVWFLYDSGFDNVTDTEMRAQHGYVAGAGNGMDDAWTGLGTATADLEQGMYFRRHARSKSGSQVSRALYCRNPALSAEDTIQTKLRLRGNNEKRSEHHGVFNWTIPTRFFEASHRGEEENKNYQTKSAGKSRGESGEKEAGKR
ncbi:hypothetical protein Hypma_009905 [Hypsizygus marmoreus]|uniref:Uncharacterized protein n=1 Tax=Hypsizygus marmoreus TaxID=39966 RepID=A0A369JQY0_HYPMA|nr:hypothetical protein Hypma_009905 [Hypsizygus marmoreus]